MTQQQTQGGKAAVRREADRCDDCGELLFFNQRMWSSATGKSTHIDCERAAKVRGQLPSIYDLAIQSLVKIDELLGCFICQSEDDEYADVEVLQRKLHRAYALSSEGVRSEARWRESFVEAVLDV